MSTPYERRTGLKRLVDFDKIINALKTNRLLWVTPTVVFMVVGLLYAVTKEDSWEASQALVVRDEAIGELGMGSGTPLGRFDSNDLLKRSLETILQIAKNPNVARTAMETVGPEKKNSKKPLTDKDVESFLKDISVSAPKGTEFGTSEVIYLSVTSSSPERAVGLTNAVCDQLDARMKELRNEHATSIIAELEQKQELAQNTLDEATRELSKMEGSLGADLGEMRTLVTAGSGDSNLRRSLTQIKIEMRQAEGQVETQSKLIELLMKIGDDPDAILATPQQLLEVQPALSRLKDGFVDAQLRTARLSGGMTEQHPRVQAARLNEENIKQQLLREARNAIATSKAQMIVNRQLRNSLGKKLREVQTRLDELARQRAPYANLTAKVEQRREQLRLASVAVAEGRGRQSAALAASLITRLDAPIAGTRPVGPGSKIVVLGSTFGGLLLGLSLVYLIAPWQEANRAGRRKTDVPKRRASDDGQDPDRRLRELTNPRASDEQDTPAALQLHTVETVAESCGGGTHDQSTQSLDHLAQLMKSSNQAD